MDNENNPLEIALGMLGPTFLVASENYQKAADNAETAEKKAYNQGLSDAFKRSHEAAEKAFQMYAEWAKEANLMN